ncbi:hypothetical protein ABK040_014585 [Willaertia magna]
MHEEYRVIHSPQLNNNTNNNQELDNENDDNIKVLVPGTTIQKAIHIKKIKDTAIRMTREKQENKLYKISNFLIKPNYDIGIVIQLDPLVKVLTSNGIILYKNEVEIGDLIQFIPGDHGYAKDAEIIERPEYLPEDFHLLYDDLRIGLIKLKEKFSNVGITFKVKKKKKR